jgi:hypothetical protein
MKYQGDVGEIRKRTQTTFLLHKTISNFEFEKKVYGIGKYPYAHPYLPRQGTLPLTFPHHSEKKIEKVTRGSKEPLISPSSTFR